ncbi:hypothetical protein [Snuella lapsa]|uniref:Lipoprotein n=1 Tax=Snuella lapsa TaxID=870481 RepID=A0ABP6Y1R1_9FLAO
MRNLLLLILVFNLSSCHSQKKEKTEKNIVEYSCDCIAEIPKDKDNQELLIETQKCISDSYEVYTKYVENLANKYFEKNPNAQLTDAQNWIRKVLTEKLVKNCPRYSKIVSQIAFKKRNDSDIIKEVAKKVCEEINALKVKELSWNEIDPIFVSQTVMNDQAIREKYDLNNKTEMTKYSTDLVQELVATCERYRQFTVKIKK